MMKYEDSPFQNGDPEFRRRKNDDPYERGFADRLYADGDEPTVTDDPIASFLSDDLLRPYDTDELPQDDEPRETTSYIPQPAPQRPKRKKKKKHRALRVFGGILLVLLVLLAGVVALLHVTASPPADGEGHRDDAATILLAGTDASGNQTDTLMLLNIDRAAGRMSLMSIPRDTKVNSTYVPHKINGAYVANGKGEEGMDALMDYVGDCVGFRPDGYVLIDLDVFVELVDLFGGVEFDVPQDMYYEDSSQDLFIDLKAGLQTLDGQQAMGLVRYRSGYAMADLQRVEVQRNFVMSAIDQWLTPKNLLTGLRALPLVSSYTQTDLSVGELTWLAESALLCGTDDMQLCTVPYYLNDIYVCIAADDSYLSLINTYFNPYETEIGYGDLNIAY